MIMNVVSFVAISALVTLGLALVLVASQKPVTLPDMQGGLGFAALTAQGTAPAVPQITVPMRDGWVMPVRHIPATDKPLLVLIHGSGWHGQQFDRLAATLQGEAEILAPDLRGHGANPARRGDIDHIDQFEEDLADLIAAHRKPQQKLVVAGHSSGGGLAIRFASGPQAQNVDHVILMAPFLKHDAPTTRTNSGGWAHVLIRRMIGLTILNTIKITALNHLTVIQFAMPAAVLDGPLGHTATTAYSYRLNTGFAPRAAYKKDIAALPPFTLLAGTQDEAFLADQYEPVMSAENPRGTYHLIEGQTHLGIVDAPESLAILKGVLREL